MPTMRIAPAGVALCVLLMCVCGCHPPRAQKPQVDPSAEVRFADAGIGFSYPAGWEVRHSPDYRLVILPAGASPQPTGAGDVAPSISLDVPDLPIRLPGMVQMGPVMNGFLDDLRKHVGSLEVLEDSAADVRDAQSRLVRSRWTAGGMQYTQTALLLIHADRVYIIRSTTDAAGESRNQAAFQRILATLHWL
jgi:hypothetical protein